MMKKRKPNPNEIDPKMKNLGKLIRGCRLYKDMTIEQLAYQSDVSVSYMWQIETGRNNISYCTLWRIADSLGVPSGQLLYGTDSQLTFQNECPLKHVLKQCSNCRKKDFFDCCLLTGSESAKCILICINSLLNRG